ncbi:putative signal transducing protein [Reichenbachiella ulvae]|uniref:DUF2007 domain-containing protein n=1 Tax=Reichenbachiella ulvae TaxID=2980104 RepID=A0ABT3D0L8_9BACT|nr:DUF2007 domain-containing protein [Reichenbachiella ulvae]MCV9389432.1 DUF2007 domain-containing protein [Reichenbachiella ulvae]
MALSLLTTCEHNIDADLVRTKLESEGITCFLHNENVNNLLPHHNQFLGGGVRVMVMSEQLAQAQEIIGEFHSKTSCPSCGSINLRLIKQPFKSILNAIMIGLFLIPAGKQKMHWVCKDCGESFKD